jgi:hypothetical protein
MDRINDILSDVNSALSQHSNPEDMVDSPELTLEDMKELLEIQAVQQQLNKLKNIKAEDGNFLEVENTEIESVEQEMLEYKKDFYDMSVGSLMAIMSNAQKIIENLSNPQVAENLTESWLQGKIAITEDYMRTIHDFVLYVNHSDDNT